MRPELMQQEQDTHGSQFVFLAANQDAIQEGGKLAISAKDTRDGIRDAYGRLSSLTSRTRRRAARRLKKEPLDSDEPKIGSWQP